MAVRVDSSTGTEERLEHVETARGSLYTWTARPLQAQGCVLICSSIFGDFTANYHRERNLGRALAARGVGAIRFHYSGEGNSHGERQQMTFGTLCDDAAVMIEHAQSLGFTQLAVAGTRLGGLVAAATAASIPLAPLAIWEPVTDPLRFLTEAQRAKRISQVAQEKAEELADWRQELRQKGRLDLLGYDVYEPMIDSLAGLNLVDLVGAPPRSIFLGRFGGSVPATDLLADSLRGRGFSVDTAAFGLSESWWFHNEFVSDSGNLISATCDWLEKETGRP